MWRARDNELGGSQRAYLQPASGLLAALVAVAAIALTPASIGGDVNPASAAALRPHKTGVAVRPRKARAVVSPLKAGMAELYLSLNRKTGVIGNTWWQGAVALSTLETYQQTTGDTAYSSAIQDAFTSNKSGNLEKTADDDTAWWGLAWLQAYDITGSRQYLAMAETDADYVREAGTAPAAAGCGG